MENSNMSVPGSTNSFIIRFDDEKPRSTAPKRLTNHNNGRSKSREDLNRKQKDADKRRNEYKEAMLTRIGERREECLRINTKAELLLAQDAKRQGLPGTEDIKRMNSRDVKMTIQSLAQDMSKIDFVIQPNEGPS